ncbi:C-type lectin mannose-binding isoform-like [Pseudonaja textilis]|uniref:C-type lectin mannose-binding isoform-like n=1 Tax=Pseudonaja textilis TaxID=8673 RepID=UPI000EAAA3B8|nr:C-type lectin mannose-binding isoform-like [Pseudonaja textilis]
MGLIIYLSAFLVSFLLSCSFFGVSADTCAREWLQYQGNSYGYFEAKKTWTEAEIECQSYHRGAHLASILTLAETLVVANHIMSYQIKPSNVWIGLHDIRHANFLHLLFSTALKLLAGLCTGILLFGYLGYFSLQDIDGRHIRFGTTLHFSNGKWRWSDESTYNYKAWMLGKPNLSWSVLYMEPMFQKSPIINMKKHPSEIVKISLNGITLHVTH